MYLEQGLQGLTTQIKLVVILLFSAFQHWDYRCVSPHPVSINVSTRTDFLRNVVLPRAGAAALRLASVGWQQLLREPVGWSTLIADREDVCCRLGFGRGDQNRAENSPSNFYILCVPQNQPSLVLSAS